MPSYVFTVQSSRSAPDTTDIDLAGPEQARSLAMREASEMLWDHWDKAWPTQDWWVHVADEEGATVCRLTISVGTED